MNPSSLRTQILARLPEGANVLHFGYENLFSRQDLFSHPKAFQLHTLAKREKYVATNRDRGIAVQPHQSLEDALHSNRYHYIDGNFFVKTAEEAGRFLETISALREKTEGSGAHSMGLVVSEVSRPIPANVAQSVVGRKAIDSRNIGPDIAEKLFPHATVKLEKENLDADRLVSTVIDQYKDKGWLVKSVQYGNAVYLASRSRSGLIIVHKVQPVRITAFSPS